MKNYRMGFSEIRKDTEILVPTHYEAFLVQRGRELDINTYIIDVVRPMGYWPSKLIERLADRDRVADQNLLELYAQKWHTFMGDRASVDSFLEYMGYDGEKE